MEWRVRLTVAHQNPIKIRTHCRRLGSLPCWWDSYERLLPPLFLFILQFSASKTVASAKMGVLTFIFTESELVSPLTLRDDLSCNRTKPFFRGKHSWATAGMHFFFFFLMSNVFAPQKWETSHQTHTTTGRLPERKCLTMLSFCKTGTTSKLTESVQKTCCALRCPSAQNPSKWPQAQSCSCQVFAMKDQKQQAGMH